MDKEFEFIIKAIKNIKLKEDEKVVMRTHLLGKTTPPQTKEAPNVTNLKTDRLYYYYQKIKNYYFMNNKHKFVPAFIMTLIVVLTGGTSAFAEKAVPGDLLYGVKVSVNEPAAGIFALSKKRKTEWKERLVERRLEEGQRLVAENSLDEGTRINLENKIKSQINDFSISANELALMEGKSIDSLNVNIRLQASLRAHQDVFERILGEIGTDTDTKKETEKLVSALKESKKEVKRDHEQLESNTDKSSQTISNTSTSVNSSSTLAKQATAENLLKSAKLSYQKEKANLSINIQNQIEGKLASAENSLQEGKTFITSDDYPRAIEKFQSVISIVNTANLLMLSNVIKEDIEDDMGIEDDDEDIEDEEEFERADDGSKSLRLESGKSNNNSDEFEDEDD